jgi:hypothetical protein
LIHRHICVACGRVIDQGQFECGIAGDHDCGLCLRCQDVRPGEFHAMDDARLAKVSAQVAGYLHQATANEVRLVCLASEPLGPDYQDWLDTADTSDIADWAAQEIRLGRG